MSDLPHGASSPAAHETASRPAREAPRPRLEALHLLVTYRCTFACDHCFVWGSPDQDGTMTLAQLQAVVDQAAAAGCSMVYFEGGEPMLAYPVVLAAARHAREAGLGLVVLAGLVEMDIAQMSPEDQREFVGSLGLAEPAIARFLREAYALLDLISFLTAGEDECRAWPIRRGLTAPKAAGKIHSDIERGFIRAEVTHWDDLVRLKSEAKCREAGKLRSEGKEYVVHDGDVINFRFNV